ncbi:MAG: NgoPII family restriction endonuclease [Methanobrevibacter sp.]|jgi:hypothetical protein|nr:NgoPII family restriction endonuclease [Candidatus Methanoflexus mossambicus]
METNILKSIINIKNFDKYNLEEIYPPESEMSSLNRINSVGVGLEYFIKDSFSNSFEELDKIAIHSNILSWLGNTNNPPDMMIKNGDAVEVKKMESKSSIALNSSHPKFKLRNNDIRVSDACKNCEEWNEKDIVYAVGIVKNKVLNNLFFVYGDLYCAEEEVYNRIFKIISQAIVRSDLELSPTKELGRINRVDPLGITYLRIRGMWGIEHPLDVYNYILKDYAESNDESNLFNLNALMKEDKYLSFPEKDRFTLENDKDINVEKVKVKDPNNPAKLINSILINYCKK